MADETRKLVYIKQIDEIIPHNNADSLEIAVIGGWNIIVQKSIYSVGDYVVYFEIDSMLPVTEEFEFLRKYCYIKKDWLSTIMPNSEAFRIKSLKLRGVISQGLIIPISDSLSWELSEGNVHINDDLTDFFKVKKYEVPTNHFGLDNTGNKRNFPEFIAKTKQERIQNISKKELNDAFNNHELFECTRKYHGSSITVYAVNDTNVALFTKLVNKVKSFFSIKNTPAFRVGVCSRNIELDPNVDSNSFVSTANKTGLCKAVKQYCLQNNEELAFQGELCGPGIHDNHHNYLYNTIVIFDIFDIRTQKYLDPVTRYNIVLQIHDYGFTGQHAELEFPYIPLPSDDIPSLLKIAEYKLKSGKENEGHVWKSLKRDFSFKVVSNKFLLEEK